MKRRYRYNNQSKKMEEVNDEQHSEIGGLIIGDIEPFISPIDGSVIGTRPQLREHMRRHGVTHSSDFDSPGGHWDKLRQKRADHLAGKINLDSKRRKQQLSDSFENLRNKMRYSK